jgi:hypothetical protein
MTEQVSLKLCLLTSIIKKSEEEVEDKVLISNPKNNVLPYQIQSRDRQNSISGVRREDMNRMVHAAKQ